MEKDKVLQGYQAPVYQESDAVKNAQQQLQQQIANKPGDYQSQWQGQLDSLFQQIQNKKPFQYDINTDALYQQAAQQYIQQGQKAMMDTMGQAAALTGGYGNSYAQSVGQQTYQGYLQGLYEQMPQYAQLALDRYNQEGQDMISANRAADLLEILDEGLTEEIEGAAKDDPIFRHLSDRYSMFHSLMETVEYQLNEAIQVADNTFQLTKRLFQEAQKIA